MIHKIKALGLAFIAVLALGAVVASAAQAVGIDTTAGAGSVVLTGQNEIGGVKKVSTLTAAGFQVSCQEATLEGTITGQEVTEAEVTATYSGCQVFGTTATVDMNGCKYTFKETASTTAEAGVTGCTTGKTIQVTTGLCTINIGNQAKDFPHVVFSNATTQDIIANATAGSQISPNGIVYQEVGSFCPNGNGAQRSDAEFRGETTVQAFEDEAAQEQVTIMGHQFTRHLHGAAVGVQVT